MGFKTALTFYGYKEEVRNEDIDMFIALYVDHSSQWDTNSIYCCVAISYVRLRVGECFLCHILGSKKEEIS